VEGAIAARTLASEVEFSGYVDNMHVPKYLASMNVFVLSSDHEGLPNSVLEAAASGVPVVATAVYGVKDIYRDSSHALLVPPRDARACRRHRVRPDRPRPGATAVRGLARDRAAL